MKDETEAGAIEAVASLQRRSDDLGTSTITSEEIDAEIRAVRKSALHSQPKECLDTKQS